jgi:hypothetical protein
MFKRWVILLLVLLAACAASFYYHAEKSAALWAVLDECSDYLDTVNNDWDRESDRWYYQRCDLGNYASYASSEQRSRDRIYYIVNLSFGSFVYILIMLFLSFIGRWLVTGRLKWD